MSQGDQLLLDDVRDELRKSFLQYLKTSYILGPEELSLFEWYIRKTGELSNEMLSAERAYIQEQIDGGAEGVNDSGMIAVEYYIKRVRYSDIIYMTSLLETYLTKACAKLASAMGERNIIFSIDELAGDKWSKRKKFLERYGQLNIPEDIWAEIDVLISIRNNLVHDNGDTGVLNKKQRREIQKRPGVNIDDHEVVIEDHYIQHALAAMRSLVQFVEKELGSIVDRAIRS